ncbi:class I SAM-dependent methyltransferase [Rhodopseudomonas sp. G2_2311]|uniref:class I SAM-dependent DNA methyltransferase n=1 Tax=Rhodopseudomonas sp. G2_2311 TaxID=3114287 RepID=UPI0039C6A100
MTADAIIGLYTRHAQQWDRERGRTLLERAWLEQFRHCAGDGAAVLDLGCGSGEPIARFLIAAGHGVTGLDSSPGLIELAQRRFPDQHWVVGDMRRADLKRLFGGILAWDSFFHLSPNDQRAMFAVFRAHAAPGAALMFTSGPAEGVATGSYQGEPLYHASLAPAEYRRLLARHGFTVVAHRANDPDCCGHTVWLAKSG